MNALSKSSESRRGFEDTTLTVYPGQKFFSKSSFLQCTFMRSGTGYLLLFCKGTIVTVQKNLFFDMYFLVPFVPRSLVTASFSRKFYLLFLPLGIIVTEKVKEVFLKT